MYVCLCVGYVRIVRMYLDPSNRFATLLRDLLTSCCHPVTSIIISSSSMSSTNNYINKNNNNNSDTLLLNYNDACIYQRDLSLLQSNSAWLNDACINFYMTYLSMKQSQRWEAFLRQRSSAIDKSSENVDDSNENNDIATDGTNNDNEEKNMTKEKNEVLFLDPSVISFMMHQCDDEDLGDFAFSWKPNTTTTTIKRFYIPINDNFAVSKRRFCIPGGGNHWSLLLVICRVVREQDELDGEAEVSKDTQPQKYQMHYFHFDSSRGHNSQCAQIVAQRFYQAMRLVLYNDDDKICNGAKEEVNVRECNTPQQNNSYDCGVYTLITAEALSDPSLLFGTTNDSNTIDLKEIQQQHEDALHVWCQTRGRSVMAARYMRKKMVDEIQRLSKVYLENKSS